MLSRRTFFAALGAVAAGPIVRPKRAMVTRSPCAVCGRPAVWAESTIAETEPGDALGFHGVGQHQVTGIIYYQNGPGESVDYCYRPIRKLVDF